MDDEDRAELVSRLFALLTAQLEDGAAVALQGQSRDLLPAQHERAQSLEILLRDGHSIAQALLLLTQSCKSAGE